jgi:dTDP-4-dehydrorhamnose 3,5-epimerase
MKITGTPLKDLMIVEPTVFKDSRGYFFESYHKEKLHQAGIHINFIQDNQSKSEYGVIRGLHYQLNPKAQTKLVRVIQGTIFDVAVDIRINSPDYGKWFGLELSEENNLQLFIPKGFAHGFSVLSKSAVILYKCDEFYAPETEAGIIYNDRDMNIDWKIPAGKEIVSDKDGKLPSFKNCINNFHE